MNVVCAMLSLTAGLLIVAVRRQRCDRCHHVIADHYRIVPFPMRCRQCSCAWPRAFAKSPAARETPTYAAVGSRTGARASS